MNKIVTLCLVIFVCFSFAGCSGKRVVRAELTGYDGCGKCCGWERGFPDFWNKYVSVGPRKGADYTGQTASGTYPRTPYPGLVSLDTITHPWKLPFRLVMPWLWFSHCGTAAGDTAHHPFGTRLDIPGYGCAIVEDRGSAIKGYGRFDLFFENHATALKWGRKKIEITVSQ